MKQSEKTQAENTRELIIKPLPWFVRGGNPIAKGICYTTYLYSDKKVSAIKLTSKST
jgi:hypothetical protein